MQFWKFRPAWLYVCGVLAVVVPVLVAVRMARHESLERQKDKVSMMAAQVLTRAEHVSEQLTQSFQSLRALNAPDPCAPDMLQAMRAAVVKSSLLVDVGYISNDQLVCSAFGHSAVAVGPPTYVTPSGYYIRTGLRHPLAPDVTVVIATDARSGYSGVVRQAVALENVPDDGVWVAGLVGTHQKAPLAQRGAFQDGWLQNIGNAKQTSFYDGDSIVGWQRSRHFEYAAYAALPKSAWVDDWHRVVWVLAPLGLVAGVSLAYVLARLIRLKLSMVAMLKQALKAGELFLVYQPIVDLHSGAWVGAEALLRWRTPSGELISPEVFIPIAERNNLIGRVTEHVIELLEADAGVVFGAYPRFFISINLSADDFRNKAMPKRLEQVVERLGMGAGNLQVEATEGVFMDSDAMKGVLQEMRQRGIAVAIDDFGTGYSSLSYLTTLPLDRIKIDKAFVDSIGTGAVTSQVIDHIISLAHSLRLPMVAEGVETAAQDQYLRHRGVQYAQGWLYSKPLSIEFLRAGLARHSPQEVPDTLANAREA